MKPTPQVSHQSTRRANFPLVDYHYQTTRDTSVAGATAVSSTRSLRAIWKMSAEFFGAEAGREYAIELSSFCLLATLSAWPIVTMLIAVVRMVRNY
jgi:hypothetical protein